MLMLVMSIGFVGCSDDDDEPEAPKDAATAVAGNYVGKLEIIGYVDEPERAYVTLTRIASDAVTIKISCEAFDMDMSPVNLNVTKSGQSYSLKSESSKSISGNVVSNTLSVTFQNQAGYTYKFSGEKILIFSLAEKSS